jgi:hypothetical protein
MKMIVAILIGTILGIAFGYATFHIGGVPHVTTLEIWLIGTYGRIDVFLWAAAGGAVAAGLRFIFHQNSN